MMNMQHSYLPGSVLVAVLALAQASAQENEPTWIVGAGAFVVSNPYEGAEDDIEAGGFPFFQYQGERISVDPSGVSLTAHRNSQFQLDLLVSPRWQLVDLDDLEGFEELDMDRGVGVDLGARLSRSFGPVTASLSYLGDVSGESEGQEATFQLALDYTLTPRLQAGFGTSVSWRDDNLATWLYGIRPEDKGGDLTYEYGVTPGAAEDGVIVPSASLQFRYQVTDRVFAIVAAEVEYLGDDITDSPLVEDDVMVSSFIGLARTF